uniref:FAM65 N-terminal domain-containing protein n=1 Tax=Denticeps clupeoides TaxID=299321 RepID=A0AAY4ERG0_9TELE
MPSAQRSPSRAVSTMSLSVRPTRRVASRSITRSQSFAGVNSYDKPYRSLSVFSTPGCTRKTASRSSRMFTLSAKSPPPKVPQPERLDEVYEALKRGLQSYLQVHQAELENLSRQMKESKRNSRLQVKVIERFMRRLEFHLSKIDELYEAYCMQRRLRDGANKMVKAYTASTGSREARESLSEANKGFKEYTENMCMLESELESQLGEFHIKMKGLAGFARLCAGDQYEIFMKYGRQRWKLKGRIEINGRQVWDSEEMVFLPLITEFLSIKVTELKSLANHVVVGSVSCETKDLFTALPQTVAVDINDLGTIKLSLEVTWNPFDKDDQASTASTVNKAPTVNKRFSTYNQSPPDTPSLREQAFYNMLRRQEEMENGTAWSNSSESSDDSSSPQLSLGMRHAHKNLVQPEIQAAAPAIEISFALRESATSTPTRLVPNGHTRFSRSFSHISETSADGALADRAAGEAVEPSEVASLVSVDNDMDRPNRAEASEPSHTAEPVNRSDGSCSSPADPATQDNLDNSEAVPEDKPTDTEQAGRASPRTEISSQPCGTTAAPDRPGSVVETQPMDSEELQTPDGALEDSLTAVMSSLDDYRGQFPELQVLEQELRLLEEVLTGRSRSRSSSVSLTVETVLGSFDFLNTSDLEEEAEIPADRSEFLVVPVSQTVSCQDRRYLRPRLGTFGPLRCGEMYALDQLLRETRVLELIRRVTKDNADRIIQPEEGGVMQRAVSLWKQCTDGSSVYSTSTEAFLQTLGTSYTSRVPERVAGLTDTVFVHLVERILQKKLPKRGGGAAREMITIFQFWSYLEAEGVVELDTHITELAEEVWLVQSLQSGDQDVLVKALKKPLECSLKREGLRAVSLLLRDPRGKVCSAASSLLRSLADQTRHRERALVSCLELLEDECLETRVCGCKALACLKAKESIEQLVYLCLLGEEGKMAHRHVETSQEGMPRLFTPGSMASTAF